MLRKKSGSLEWLEFELFQEFPELQHGVFLSNDSEKIKSQFGCPFYFWRQVHGIHIEVVPSEKPDLECDGLMTQHQNAGLLIKHADCQAVIFYDPIKKAIASIHAGWRGNVQNIYGVAVAKMRKEYGTKPENLFVGVSPSLGPCCAQFIHYEKEIPNKFWTFQTRPLYFDLWEMARMQLLEEGVVAHHLEISPICTCCSPENFPSYRRDKKADRLGTAVALKKL